MRDFPTFKLGDNIMHYTCQSVSPNSLKKNWIKTIWEKFDIGAIEVLSIPVKLFKKLWMFTRSSEEMTVNAEKILRNLK